MSSNEYLCVCDEKFTKSFLYYYKCKAIKMIREKLIQSQNNQHVLHELKCSIKNSCDNSKQKCKREIKEVIESSTSMTMLGNSRQNLRNSFQKLFLFRKIAIYIMIIIAIIIILWLCLVCSIIMILNYCGRDEYYIPYLFGEMPKPGVF